MEIDNVFFYIYCLQKLLTTNFILEVCKLIRIESIKFFI